ncbi:MAG: ABC transporter permease [Acidobacteriaceae bacterium]
MEAPLGNVGQDLQYALRQLRKNPGFAITAVLTLALGIGAITAIFSLIYNVMLKPLPVKNPAALYKLGSDNLCCNFGMLQNNWGIFSYDQYRYFKDHTRGFESLAASQAGQSAFSMRKAGDAHTAESTESRFVSGNYFATLRAPLLLGRPIMPADDVQSAPAVAVLSYRMWQRRFGLDPKIVGSTLLLNGTAVTVVGITDPGFFGEMLGADPPEFWLPLGQEPKLTIDTPRLNRGGVAWLNILGRTAPGAEPTQIESQLNVELKQWLRSRDPDLRPQDRAHIDQQRTALVSARTGVNNVSQNYGRALELLMAAAAFVLLIVCANVANLLLVRAVAQRQQTAVRIALGASRRQLIRQALVTSVTLAVLGGVAATGVAFAIAKSVMTLAFRGAKYVPLNVTPSWPVLAFALGVSLLTGVVFGVAPAWLATHADPAEALRGSARTTRDSSSLPQRVLVIFQAAMSVVLLCAAGLLLRSLANLQHQDFGFKTDHRFILQMDPELAGYKPDQMDDLDRKLQARLMQIPGAQQAALSLYTPMVGNNWSQFIALPGQPSATTSNRWYDASWVRVTPDYFDAIGTKLRRGRLFTDADDARTRLVAVVSEAFADRFFKGKDAIGQHFGFEPELPSQFEIVGVVENTKYDDPEKPAPPMYFLPFAQRFQAYQKDYATFEPTSRYARNVTLHVEGGSASAIEAAARRAFAEVDPNLPVDSFMSFDEQVGTNFNQQELLARLTTLFGITALVLASIGLYGVTAYSVQRRAGEIGVRMALGANRGRILRDVLVHALRQCGQGLLIGIPLAYAAGRALTTHLYGVPAFDPAIVLITVAVLGVSAAIAAMIPARRAASIEPMQALRSE